MDVRIRPYRLGDASIVCAAVRESIDEVQPWMPWCHPNYSEAESRAWLETQVPAFVQGTAYEFAIVSGRDEYLGGCGLNQLDTMNRRANLGYWVRTSTARRGVATEAVHALREWAFTHTNLIRLEILVAVDNAASRRVAEKSGATREGTLKSRLLLHGHLHDAVIYSFVRQM